MHPEKRDLKLIPFFSILTATTISTVLATNKIHTTTPTTATAAKSLQSCLTLCDPIDGSPPGSPVPGILQARTLEWIAISFSNAWKWKVKVKLLSHVRLLATSRTAASQAPPSMGFSRQECWSDLADLKYGILTSPIDSTFCLGKKEGRRPMRECVCMARHVLSGYYPLSRE